MIFININYYLNTLNNIINKYNKKYDFIQKINTLNKLQNKKQIFSIIKEKYHNNIYYICDKISIHCYSSYSNRYSLYTTRIKIQYIFDLNNNVEYKNLFILYVINKYINKHYKNKYSNLSRKEIIKMFKIICNHYINIYKQKFDIKKE